MMPFSYMFDLLTLLDHWIKVHTSVKYYVTLYCGLIFLPLLHYLQLFVYRMDGKWNFLADVFSS